MSAEDRQKDIAILAQYGVFAKDCLTDGKHVLADILSAKQIDCTQDELSAVYAGLKDLSCDTTLSVFEKELKTQIGRISFARNKVILQETWKSVSGIDTVREWCTTHEAPLMWIVPKDLQKAFATLLDVQRKNQTIDTAVVAAINELRTMDVGILTDTSKIEAAFLAVVGSEYVDIWNSERTALLTKAKMQFGNDMSAWSIGDLTALQRILKQAQQEKAKKEKLAGTKASVRNMKDSVLRDRVAAFLDAHPEFCDNFAE